MFGYVLYTFFSANEAVWPPLTSVTGSLLRWMLLIGTGMNSPREVGPSSSVSLSRITPCIHVPEITVPTPYGNNNHIGMWHVQSIWYVHIILVNHTPNTTKLTQLCSTHRDGISLINLELSWLIISDRHSSSEQVEETLEQVQIVTCYIGHLKDGADPTVRIAEHYSFITVSTITL